MHVVQHLDEDLWRDFVDRNPHGNIFHTPEMFQVFARARDCSATLWAVVDGGRVLALLPPVQMTVLPGLLSGLTTRAVAYGSVLCAEGGEGREALAALLRTYRHEVRGSVLFTELRNLSDLGELQPTLGAGGFVYEDHLDQLIDLTRPSEALWQGMRPNARQNVRKAQRSGVAIEEVNDAARMPAVYEVLRRVYKHIQVPLPDESLFRAAFEVLHPRGMLRVTVARVDGVDVGVLLLLRYKGILYGWYTGILREHQSYRPSDLLFWDALETGQREGFHTFDFGGAGRPDQKYGVRDFKAKFGGELVNYGRNTCVHSPVTFRLSQVGYRLVRRYL